MRSMITCGWCAAVPIHTTAGSCTDLRQRVEPTLCAWMMMLACSGRMLGSCDTRCAPPHARDPDAGPYAGAPAARLLISADDPPRR